MTDSRVPNLLPLKISRDEARLAGLKRFFTAKPCFRGHCVERLVRNGVCADCERERKRKYAQENPDKAKRWREITDQRRGGPRKRTAQSKINSKPTPEKRLEYQRKWKIKATPEWRKEQSLKRLARDKLNPEGRRTRGRNRSARKKMADGSHTAADIQKIYHFQNGKCATCRRKVLFEAKHVDHIQPLARGGSNNPSNLQILCSPCNLRKSAKDPMEWAKQNGTLV